LDQISQTARESVVAMDAIVWALNPRNDSLDNFANYISQFMREFFRPTQLRTRMDLPANLPTHRLATETRHQLFLLVKESFNNVVRHADATEVRLELACENDRLRLCVADNGRGISKQTAEGGNGLTNLKRRAEDLGGSLEIESRNGHGARLEFVFPLKNLQTN
jgi:signal transduction histidine kinase